MNLAAVEQLSLLQRLYDRVVIPEAVVQELLVTDSERLVVPAIQTLSWIETRSVANRSLVDSLLLELDAAEAEAIVLAMEMRADLLLVDERRGRRVASRLGLRFIGLLGVLLEAKRKGFIATLKPVLDGMIVKAGFWIGNELYARVLREAGE